MGVGSPNSPGRSWERAGPCLSSGLLGRCLTADRTTAHVLWDEAGGSRQLSHLLPRPWRDRADGPWCGRGPPQDKPFSHQPPVVASVTRSDRVGLAVLAKRVAAPQARSGAAFQQEAQPLSPSELPLSSGITATQSCGAWAAGLTPGHWFSAVWAGGGASRESSGTVSGSSRAALSEGKEESRSSGRARSLDERRCCCCSVPLQPVPVQCSRAWDSAVWARVHMRSQSAISADTQVHV